MISPVPLTVLPDGVQRPLLKQLLAPSASEWNLKDRKPHIQEKGTKNFANDSDHSRSK